MDLADAQEHRRKSGNPEARRLGRSVKDLQHRLALHGQAPAWLLLRSYRRRRVLAAVSQTEVTNLRAITFAICLV